MSKTTINYFQVKGLHGNSGRIVKLVFNDNTLVLIGENGAGKTTLLQLFYYIMSGQWPMLRKYAFDEIDIGINGDVFKIKHADVVKALGEGDNTFLRHLPSHVQEKALMLAAMQGDASFDKEFERMRMEYGIPMHYVHELRFNYEKNESRKNDALRKSLSGIRNNFKSKLLYLPTYRRIEQELGVIFNGVNLNELNQRTGGIQSRRNGDAYIELIEFGMNDVKEAINGRLNELSSFARLELNNLTFSYLGDILESKYQEVDVEQIKSVSQSELDNVLNRIRENVLSEKNKQHLRDIVSGMKRSRKKEGLDEHTKIISHYLAKLINFQKDLEKKEEEISQFCKICNQYMPNKQFTYDATKFKHSIVSADGREIQLQQLSSGEKQIVSLFSHIYLSEKSTYFALIDEPELSLSVPWQKKFLADIKSGKNCTGIFAVTHSPFIYDNGLRKYAHSIEEFVQ